MFNGGGDNETRGMSLKAQVGGALGHNETSTSLEIY